MNKSNNSTTRALIGSTGVIGATLQDHMQFDRVYNSHNINELQYSDHIVVAAPSGNRLKINTESTADRLNIEQIVTNISRVQPRHIALISSVDVVTAPHTVYGANRAWLEQQLSSIAPVTVLRLSTLIGARIQKNLLYDIRHAQFLDKINPDSVIQWCLLDDLPNIIDQTPTGTTVNIVSEPIANHEVCARFLPGYAISSKPNPMLYNQKPYVYTKADIFAAMEKYLQ